MLHPGLRPRPAARSIHPSLSMSMGVSTQLRNTPNENCAAGAVVAVIDEPAPRGLNGIIQIVCFANIALLRSGEIGSRLQKNTRSGSSHDRCANGPCLPSMRDPSVYARRTVALETAGEPEKPSAKSSSAITSSRLQFAPLSCALLLLVEFDDLRRSAANVHKVDRRSVGEQQTLGPVA